MAKTEFEDIKLYGGKVMIRFYPNSHRYFLMEGETKTPLDSVTSITGIIDKSSALLAWAERLTNEWAEENLPHSGDLKPPGSEIDFIRQFVKEAAHQYAVKKQEAASIGDIVHDYAQAFATAKIEGKPLPKIDEGTPQQAINGISAFLSWVKMNKIVFVATEQLVYSRKHKYVGRYDVLFYLNGKLCIGDYKTSVNIYPEHSMQLAAYKEAWGEEPKTFYGEIELSFILWLNKNTGEFDPRIVVNTKKSFQGFKAAMKLKRIAKELK